MGRLWLLRHAKSSWDDPELPDHDRPLASRGRSAASLMAAHVEREDIQPGLVVCSSARRARETLAAILPALGPDFTARIDPALYTFSGAQLLEAVIALPKGSDDVMLVGHNPAMQELASALAREGPRLPELREKYPTGALAGLELEVDGWVDAAPGCARLVTFVTPRELG